MTSINFIHNLPNLNRSPFFYLSDVVEEHELRDRVKSLWSAVGIISALVATIAFGNLISSNLESFSDIEAQVFGIFNFCSGLFCIASTVIISICWAALESTPSEKTREYFKRYYQLIGIPAFFFIAGSALLLIAFLILVYIQYGDTSFWVNFSVSLAVVLYLIFLQISMFVTASKQCQQIAVNKLNVNEID